LGTATNPDAQIGAVVIRGDVTGTNIVAGVIRGADGRFGTTDDALITGQSLADDPTVIASISQQTLAEIVGTTRSRVSFFMNKFRKLGFIKYNGHLEVHSSLLNVILHD